MWCDIRGAFHALRDMRCDLRGPMYLMRSLRGNPCGATYVAYARRCTLSDAICVTSSIWQRQRAANYLNEYVIQYTLEQCMPCKVRGTINVLQSMCNSRSGVRNSAQSVMASLRGLQNCRERRVQGKARANYQVVQHPTPVGARPSCVSWGHHYLILPSRFTCVAGLRL